MLESNFVVPLRAFKCPRLLVAAVVGWINFKRFPISHTRFAELIIGFVGTPKPALRVAVVRIELDCTPVIGGGLIVPPAGIIK